MQIAPGQTDADLIVEQASDETTTQDTLTHASTDTPDAPVATLNGEEAVNTPLVERASLPTPDVR